MRTGSASATVRVAFRTIRETRAVAAALAPEIQHPAGKKARARILVHDKMMSLQFFARDSSSLRAIMSSYLRMLAACMNVSNSLNNLERALTVTEGSNLSPYGNHGRAYGT